MTDTIAIPRKVIAGALYALDLSQALLESAHSIHHTTVLEEYKSLRAALEQQAAPEPVAWKTQFLSDTLTAAGMIAYGRMDKAMAERLSEGVVKFRNELFAQPQVAQQAKQGWQPIETAPTDGTVFLGLHGSKVREAYRVQRNDCEMWCFGGTSGEVEIAPYTKPTHWMPLPAAPKEIK